MVLREMKEGLLFKKDKSRFVRLSGEGGREGQEACRNNPINSSRFLPPTLPPSLPPSFPSTLFSGALFQGDATPVLEALGEGKKELQYQYLQVGREGGREGGREAGRRGGGEGGREGRKVKACTSDMGKEGWMASLKKIIFPFF